MKKLAALLIVICVALCACVHEPATFPDKPQDSKLEFWIGQDVTDVDFSEYERVIGVTGDIMYLGKDYNSSINPTPQYYVMYVIKLHNRASWDDGAYVSEIWITDPNVTLYGINCHSTFAQFVKAMKANDYVIERRDDNRKDVRLAKRDKASVGLYISDSLKQLTICLDNAD